MGAKELQLVEDVIYANNIYDIANLLESNIRKDNRNVFNTEEHAVFYEGEYYTIYADVTKYDDEFSVEVYVYDSKECINDSMCGDIEDVLYEYFTPELCENANDIYNDERI